MQEMTLSTLFAQGQIRLSEISVFNWGSFHNLHTARIDPEGTLITGDNGAGKSTFIDGLMALLQPASKASFNVMHQPDVPALPEMKDGIWRRPKGCGGPWAQMQAPGDLQGPQALHGRSGALRRELLSRPL